MMDIIQAWKKIVEIASDKKVTKEELPELLGAIVQLIGGIVALITPFLAPKSATIAKNIGKALDSVPPRG